MSRPNVQKILYKNAKYMTKIWKYRFDNGLCGLEGTARCTLAHIWIGFWPSCRDAEPLSPWCFREYRYQRGSTTHMQSWRWKTDLPYVPGSWHESLRCWSHCSSDLWSIYEKLCISSFMISISLCKVGAKAILIFKMLTILLLVSTLHNDINDSDPLATHEDFCRAPRCVQT